MSSVPDDASGVRTRPETVPTVRPPAPGTGYASTVAAVYAAHRESLTRFTTRLATAYRLPDPRHDAEDVVQSAFADALPRWAQLEHPDRWLYTVARRKVRAAARRRDRLGLVEGDVDPDQWSQDLGWTSVARRTGAADAAEFNEVMAAIARLPQRQRTAVYLRHIEGWGTAEIAALLECAPGTVFAHTHRGVRYVAGSVRPGDDRFFGDAMELRLRAGHDVRFFDLWFRYRYRMLMVLVVCAVAVAVAVAVWLLG